MQVCEFCLIDTASLLQMKASAVAAASLFPLSPSSPFYHTAQAFVRSTIGVPGGYHRCSVCNRGFHSPGRLHVHMRYHQRLQKSDNVCPICGRRSQSRSLLLVHIRTHTGERPHACSFCSYKAADPSNLTKHIRKKHPEVK